MLIVAFVAEADAVKLKFVGAIKEALFAGAVRLTIGATWGLTVTATAAETALTPLL
ncbi:MAG: hypothetical protein HQL15_08320 [Candidatus Omnitrophica bacterium]|nr:hypothetical protein [Candidatus Omnitrophota bacterium]